MSRWEEIGADCFRRRYDNLDLNIGVVRGSDGLCVFDSRCHDVEARELLDDLRELGTVPLKWVVNSHWHFDHVFGNAELQRHNPAIEIWGHSAMHRELLEYGELGRELAKQLVPGATAELDAVQIVPPDHTFDSLARLDLGGVAVELHFLGRGHTGGDIIAVVPHADVVLAGDLVEESALPGINPDSFPLEWSSTDTRMLELITSSTRVIPGHGDVVDRHFVSGQRDLLGQLAFQLRGLHANGAHASDAVAELSLSSPWPVESLESAVATAYAALEKSAQEAES